MHEVDHRLGEEAADERNLCRGCAIEMAHATVPERFEHRGIGVALHGIEHITLEIRHEAGSRRAQHGGAQAMDRFLGPPGKHDLIN
jgi:hypothetical protein